MSAQVHLTTIAEYHKLIGRPGASTLAARVDVLEPDDRPEAVLLAHIRPLALAHGWLAEYSWSKALGLQCILVREVVIIAHITTDARKLTMAQHTWQDALARAGIEAPIWRPAQRAEITARLRRKEH